MKRTLLPLCLLIVSIAFGQAPNLPHPEGWGEELINFPIDFAPGIAYQGEEHLRFTPGWGKATSEEYWSYAFLWWVNEGAVVSQQSLARDLKEYYSGLVGRNIESRKIEASKLVPVVTSFKKVEQRFEGTVSMLDYMEQKPIVLNVKVEIQDCKVAKKKAILISVSPQPAAHGVWKKFGDIWKGFGCGG